MTTATWPSSSMTRAATASTPPRTIDGGRKRRSGSSSGRVVTADALADPDLRLPPQQRPRAVGLVRQRRQRGLQAIDGERRRPAERAQRVLAELAEREHDGPRHAQLLVVAVQRGEHL